MPTGFPDYYGGLTLPVTVAEGGTGYTSVDAHALLVGNGSGKLNLIEPGTSGYFLQAQGASADPSWAAVTIDDASFTGQLSIAHGGTGTASPALVAGANVSITGSWPDNTIAVSDPPTFSEVKITTVANIGLLIGAASDAGAFTPPFCMALPTGTSSTVFRIIVAGTSNVSFTADGNLTLSGALTLGAALTVANGGTGSTNGSITGSGELDFTAGGTSHNVVLTPTNSGGNALATGLIITSYVDTTSLFLQFPKNTASGIGQYTTHYNAWIAAVPASGDWLTDSLTGDIVYRNLDGRMLFGFSTGHSEAQLSSSGLTLQHALAISSGGTGTTAPALVAGTGISITGSWPNNTIAIASATFPSVVASAQKLAQSSATLAILSYNTVSFATDYRITVSGAIRGSFTGASLVLNISFHQESSTFTTKTICQISSSTGSNDIVSGTVLIHADASSTITIASTGTTSGTDVFDALAYIERMI